MQTIIECSGERGFMDREIFYTRHFDGLPAFKIREYYRAMEEDLTEGHVITDQLILTSRNIIQNVEKFKGLVSESSSTVLRGNASYDRAIQMFGEYLSDVPKTSLEIFTKMSVLNEKFAMITMEPQMIMVLGNTLFFSIFFALHKEGVFKCYIKKCVDIALKNQNTFHNRISRYYLSIQNNVSNDQISLFLRSQISVLGSGGASTAAAFMYYAYNYFTNNRPQPTEESTLVRRAANNVLDGQGLNSSAVNYVRDFAAALAFEVGRALGSMGMSFLQGVANRHEGVIRAAAEEADRRITEHKRRS